MFEIIFSKEAEKEYNKLNDNLARYVNKGMEAIKKNPFWGIHIKKLRGELEGNYRLRLGDLRIVYAVLNDKKLVKVTAIRCRGSAY